MNVRVDFDPAAQTISLLPLDVGFDLRVQKRLVMIRPGQRFRYLRPDGTEAITTTDGVQHELRRAGYRVRRGKKLS